MHLCEWEIGLTETNLWYDGAIIETRTTTPTRDFSNGFELWGGSASSNYTETIAQMMAYDKAALDFAEQLMTRRYIWERFVMNIFPTWWVWAGP